MGMVHQVRPNAIVNVTEQTDAVQGRISAMEGPQRATDIDTLRPYVGASSGKKGLVCQAPVACLLWRRCSAASVPANNMLYLGNVTAGMQARSLLQFL